MRNGGVDCYLDTGRSRLRFGSEAHRCHPRRVDLQRVGPADAHRTYDLHAVFIVCADSRCGAKQWTGDHDKSNGATAVGVTIDVIEPADDLSPDNATATNRCATNSSRRFGTGPDRQRHQAPGPGERPSRARRHPRPVQLADRGATRACLECQGARRSSSLPSVKGYVGGDSISYRICSSSGLCATGQVSIDVVARL